MKKFFIFFLPAILLFFSLNFKDNVYATDVCSNGVNPTTCTPGVAQGQPGGCCNDSTCTTNSIYQASSCQKKAVSSCSNGQNPSPCTIGAIPSASGGCCNGYTCVNHPGGIAGLGGNTCDVTAKTCTGGTVNPTTCTTPGSQSECCNGYTCVNHPGGIAGLGGNTCTPGESSNKECDPSKANSCIGGYVCLADSNNQKFICQPGTQQDQFNQINCLNNSCKTALGDFSTDPSGFITRVFGLILSISGGIALLLIIISGYKLLASQGNPEAVKGAREQLTAAIVGLLFIILSLVILQIIGVDVLGIPLFK